MIIGVRHAPVVASMRGRCYGASDVGTVLSHDAAARSVLASLTAFDGEDIKGETLAFDTVWSSDLSRCRGLREALTPHLSGPLEVRTDVRLRELDHGAFENREWEEIQENEPAALASWGVSWQTQGPPGGESAEALERRVRAWLAGLDAAKRHLLIGHAGVMRALLVARQDHDWSEVMNVTIPHLEAIRLLA